jgi:hypothetical protein
MKSASSNNFEREIQVAKEIDFLARIFGKHYMNALIIRRELNLDRGSSLQVYLNMNAEARYR